MVTRYSTCHFAEVMEETIMAKHIGAVPELIIRCSWCGIKCDLIAQPHRLEHDLELTLRRWKDGDCSLDDMFERVNRELERSWLEAFGAAAHTLQKGKPKYKREQGMLDWTLTAPKDIK